MKLLVFSILFSISLVSSGQKLPFQGKLLELGNEKFISTHYQESDIQISKKCVQTNVGKERELSFSISQALEQYPDSSITYIYDDSNEQWIPLRKDEEVYDTSGNKIEITRYFWDEQIGQWNLQQKSGWEFDTNGNQILWYQMYFDEQLVNNSQKHETTYLANGRKYFNYSWDLVSETWIVTSKTEQTFDANGNASQSLSYAWNEASGEWILNSKSDVTYETNGENIQTTTTSYIWDSDSNQWILLGKNDNTTDENGNLLELITYNLVDSTQQWNISYKLNYTYDEYGNVISHIDYRWDFETNQLILYSKGENTTDEYGNYLTLVRLLWDKANGKWIGEYKLEHTYDSNGNILYSASNYWDESTGEFSILAYKTVWFYSDQEPMFYIDGYLTQDDENKSGGLTLSENGKQLEGEPLKNTKVYLLDAATTEILYESETDSTGYFKINGVTYRHYYFVIEEPVFTDEQHAVLLAFDTLLSVNKVELMVEVGEEGFTASTELSSNLANDTTNTDLAIWYQDFDNDGFGNPNFYIRQTTQPTGFVIDNTDCNDNNLNIYPGAPENPESGVDCNCDGVISGIGDNTKNDFCVEVFPNPTSGQFTLKINDRNFSEIKVAVVNIFGQKVFENEFYSPDIIKINLHGNASGLYFVKVSSGEELITKKIVSQY